jgi:hypothetical protein
MEVVVVCTVDRAVNQATSDNGGQSVVLLAFQWTSYHNNTHTKLLIGAIGCLEAFWFYYNVKAHVLYSDTKLRFFFSFPIRGVALPVSGTTAPRIYGFPLTWDQLQLLYTATSNLESTQILFNSSRL